jgi:hypothetical protein
LDPFENALIEDLQDLVFQHLTGKEVKQIYEVSPLWNEIASASKTCGDKLRLTIDYEGGSVHDKLQIISKNERKYKSLLIHLNSLNKTRQGANKMIMLQEVVAGLGSSLKELVICGSLKTSVASQLLRSLPQLEVLDLPQMSDDESVDLTPLLLPKLKSLTLVNPGNLWLELFSNVTTLEDFSMNHLKVTTDFHELENFVLHQDMLKKLSIWSNHPSWKEHQMFSDDSRVKFRLESISIEGLCISKENEVKFFEQQQSLKEVCIDNIGITSAEYRKILQSIWTLPKLKSFKYGGYERITDEDMVALSNIRNESVTRIHYLKSKVYGEMFEIFPNLECYKIENNYLLLKNVPSEKLATINHVSVVLVYQPPMAAFNQERFEQDTIEFIRRSEEIYCFSGLSIGREEWIQQGIRLSNNFWKNVIEISLKLEKLVIYHSGDIRELVIDCQRNLVSKRKFLRVNIFTNAIGRASVEGMEMPWRLQIINIE